MRFDVITLFPDWLRTVADVGIAGRARVQGLFELVTWDPRQWGTGVHRAVDDRPYGGGPGMVMQYAPLAAALRAARDSDSRVPRVVALTPQGRPLRQAMLREAVTWPRIVLVCGRYEGIDERLLEDWVDVEWSLGDFVLSGGELAAMAVIDACVRLLPGALGHELSAVEDSFSEPLLDCPHYTRPEVIAGRAVPPVLLSGHHARIARWRRQQALGRTWERRPDLLAGWDLPLDDAALLDEYRGLRKTGADRTMLED